MTIEDFCHTLPPPRYFRSLYTETIELKSTFLGQMRRLSLPNHFFKNITFFQSKFEPCWPCSPQVFHPNTCWSARNWKEGNVLQNNNNNNNKFDMINLFKCLFELTQKNRYQLICFRIIKELPCMYLRGERHCGSKVLPKSTTLWLQPVLSQIFLAYFIGLF